MLGICKNCNKEYRKREKTRQFCSLSCSNGFNLNGLKQVNLPLDSPKLAEFIGICLGDGYTSKYQVAITLNSINDANYLPYALDLIRELFPEPSITVVNKKGENAVEIRINSRIVADFLRTMGVVPNAKTVPSWVMKNPYYVKLCLRGLFDTEGSISFKSYMSKRGMRLYKQLNFTNYNVGIMRFVRDELGKLGFKPTMSLRRSLYLSNDRDIDKFRSVIGFSNPKLVKRSLVYAYDDYQKMYNLK